jgi:isocitrate dehydrogenase
LHYRGKFDNNEKLLHFAETLEKSVIQAVEDGFMTKDLAICVYHTAK